MPNRLPKVINPGGQPPCSRCRVRLAPNPYSDYNLCLPCITQILQENQDLRRQLDAKERIPNEQMESNDQTRAR